MNFKRLILFLVLFNFFLGSAWAKDDSSQIQITGDSVEYFYEERRAVGQGNVEINYQGSHLRADHVEVNLDTKVAIAEGKVSLKQAGALYEGERIEVNFDNHSADIRNVKATIAPHYIARGESVKKDEDGVYHISNAYVTTCDKYTRCEEEGGVPYYRVHANEVDYYPDDKIVMRDAVMYLERVPFFYIPIMVLPIIDIDQFPLEVQVGKKEEWGVFALTRYRYKMDEKNTGSILFDVRENQGLAGGVEHFYQTPALGQGALRYYYADDRCGEENKDCSRNDAHLVDETSRYRAQLRHYWALDPDTVLTTELNKLSDEFVIQDFFLREEFQRINQPENYLSVVHSKDDYTLSVLNRFRLNKFFQVVERTPQLGLDTHTHAIKDTNFYIRNQVEAARLNLRFADEDELNAETARVDLRHKLSYVWKPNDAWTATPFVASRETLYTRDEVGDDRDFVRHNLESGFDLSAKYFKTYDHSFHHFGMDWDKVRHIFTPSVKYRYQSRPTHVRESLIPFDAVDDLDHENSFVFELENKWQTKVLKKNGNLSQKRTLLRSIVAFNYLTPSINRTKLDEIEMEMDFFPTHWLQINADARYLFEFDHFETANVDVVFNRDPVWVGFGQRYANGDSNQTTAQVEWKVNDDLRIRLYERYDFEDTKNDEFEATAEIRDFFCWTLRLTYNYRNGGSFFFSLTPTGFPESAFRTGPQYAPSVPSQGRSGLLSTNEY
jgi:lipopolysaccharide export system protein LptA